MVTKNNNKVRSKEVMYIGGGVGLIILIIVIVLLVRR